MKQLWYYILLVGGPIGIIGGYFAFSEYIIKFFKWIFKKENCEKKICIKILDWFSYIDRNFTEKGIDLEELNLIEKEIDFVFKIDNNSKLFVKFSQKFIDKYLRFCGFKKEFRTKENFIKYSHIKHENLDIILGLDSFIEKTKVTTFNMPLNTLWIIIRGNFYVFYGQYLESWEGIPNEKKVIYTDIEMPVKLLRMYYKLY